MERRCARCGIEEPIEEFAGGTAQNPKWDCHDGAFGGPATPVISDASRV